MALEGEYEPSPRDLVSKQVEEYEKSNGAVANDLRGVPVVILTTIGAKTGKIRKTPLMRVEHEGSYAVVASLGGAPKNPVWYYNIVANSQVELRDGDKVWTMQAREISGEEKSAWWQRAVSVWPDYADYQKNTDRQIPVFVLEASG
jgi:deazaflavin-dependent oxidoreductase (nitroreductase family)